jgi:hypothetical protein
MDWWRRGELHTAAKLLNYDHKLSCSNASCPESCPNVIALHYNGTVIGYTVSNFLEVGDSNSGPAD